MPRVRRGGAAVLGRHGGQTAQIGGGGGEREGGRQIREEGVERSQIEAMARHLTEVIGPRLTGSPGMKKANEWTVRMFEEFGLENVVIEPWGEFGRGWSNEGYAGRILTPFQQPLHGQPRAWTGSTDGTVRGQAVVAPIQSMQDVERYRGRLADAFLLQSDMPEVTPAFEHPARRMSLESLLAPAPPPPRRRPRRGGRGGVGRAAVRRAPAGCPRRRGDRKDRSPGSAMAWRGKGGGADDINCQRYGAERSTGAGGIVGLSDAKTRSLIFHNKLPEPHTDMIFAVVANQFGLLGGLAVLGLYGIWIASAFATAVVTKDAFGRLIGVGCASIFTAQVVINVGMIIGLVPIIGITLPFLRCGGSARVTV